MELGNIGELENAPKLDYTIIIEVVCFCDEFGKTHICDKRSHREFRVGSGTLVEYMKNKSVNFKKPIEVIGERNASINLMAKEVCFDGGIIDNRSGSNKQAESKPLSIVAENIFFGDGSESSLFNYALAANSIVFGGKFSGVCGEILAAHKICCNDKVSFEHTNLNATQILVEEGVEFSAKDAKIGVTFEDVALNRFTARRGSTIMLNNAGIKGFEINFQEDSLFRAKKSNIKALGDLKLCDVMTENCEISTTPIIELVSGVKRLQNNIMCSGNWADRGSKITTSDIEGSKDFIPGAGKGDFLVDGVLSIDNTHINVGVLSAQDVFIGQLSDKPNIRCTNPNELTLNNLSITEYKAEMQARYEQ